MKSGYQRSGGEIEEITGSEIRRESYVPGSVRVSRANRAASEARAVEALPDSGFAAVTGVFIGPDRVQ
jgi:hypothetical protein